MCFFLSFNPNTTVVIFRSFCFWKVWMKCFNIITIYILEENQLLIWKSLNDFWWRLQTKDSPPKPLWREGTESTWVKEKESARQVHQRGWMWSQVVRAEKGNISKRAEWANKCWEGWRVYWSNLYKWCLTNASWQQWKNYNHHPPNRQWREIRAPMDGEKLVKIVSNAF